MRRSGFWKVHASFLLVIELVLITLIYRLSRSTEKLVLGSKFVFFIRHWYALGSIIILARWQISWNCCERIFFEIRSSTLINECYWLFDFLDAPNVFKACIQCHSGIDNLYLWKIWGMLHISDWRLFESYWRGLFRYSIESSTKSDIHIFDLCDISLINSHRIKMTLWINPRSHLTSSLICIVKGKWLFKFSSVLPILFH